MTPSFNSVPLLRDVRQSYMTWRWDSKGYLLATVHRPYKTDDPERLRGILEAFVEIGKPIVFPMHPRTRERVASSNIGTLNGSEVRVIEPVGYLDMLMLEQNAQLILTDSGGVQKEATFLPCRV